jgi:NAD+ diphosphatase
MIQEIAPKVLDNTYRPDKPEAGDLILCFNGETVGIRREADDSLSFPKRREFPEGDEHFRYLFSIDEDRYFLYDGSKPAGLPWELVRMLRQRKDRDKCMAAATGFHLYCWYRDHRFCSRCGKPLEHDGSMRMLRCPSCGMEHFPVIAPAIIVAVYDGERLLLTKYTGRAYKLYALIAGFTEIGETPEETVKREVLEEVGLKVDNIRYWGSQPWGVDQNLLLGFTAQLAGPDQVKIDEEELAVAEWFHRSEIPIGDDYISLTRAMVESFKKGEF